ncbi:hypothetical protein ASF34_18830 [Methylobacterium sp. Leaf106]|nr:hypothetical protein ASF34_18830 [Methylobacterium sp. Leaf106]
MGRASERGDSRDAIGFMQRLPFRLMLGRAYDDKDAQEMRNGRIARADVAAYIVGQIAEPSHAGKAVVFVR